MARVRKDSIMRDFVKGRCTREEAEQRARKQIIDIIEEHGYPIPNQYDDKFFGVAVNLNCRYITHIGYLDGQEPKEVMRLNDRTKQCESVPSKIMDLFFLCNVADYLKEYFEDVELFKQGK